MVFHKEIKISGSSTLLSKHISCKGNVQGSVALELFSLQFLVWFCLKKEKNLFKQSIWKFYSPSTASVYKKTSISTSLHKIMAILSRLLQKFPEVPSSCHILFNPLLPGSPWGGSALLEAKEEVTHSARLCFAGNAHWCCPAVLSASLVVHLL